MTVLLQRNLTLLLGALAPNWPCRARATESNTERPYSE